MFEWLKDKFGKSQKEEKKKDHKVPSEETAETINEDNDQATTSHEVEALEDERSSDNIETELEVSQEDETFDSEPAYSDEVKEILEETAASDEIDKRQEGISEDIESSETSVDESTEDLAIHKQVLETELEKENITEDKSVESNELKDDLILEANAAPTEDLEIHEEVLETELEKEKPKVSFFQRLKEGLTKTRDEMSYKINDLLGNYVKIDDDLLEELEYILISADVGMETTMELIDRLRDRIRVDQVQDPKAVIPLLAEEMEGLLNESNLSTELNINPAPAVILVVGVNGVGKTTTIGKLTHLLKAEGKEVILAAADTFRAAAIEQLQTWGQRTDTPVIAHREGADPAAVVYDAIQATKARGADVLICDTAGRLHNKSNLMKELEKIHRVVSKEFPEAKRESLLVLDATTGQNALIQAKTFKEVTDLTGIVLTKLDGTAKGGVILPLQTELKIPIKLVGVGESIDDLQPFYSKDFSKALLGLDK